MTNMNRMMLEIQLLSFIKNKNKKKLYGDFFHFIFIF
jgi:hypothetical protein